MDGFTLSPGLSASIFARQSCSRQHRPGDWNCATCGFLNWQRRSACLQCSSPCPQSSKSKSQARETDDAPNHTHAHPQSFPSGGIRKEVSRQNHSQVPLPNLENARPVVSNICEEENNFRDGAVLREVIDRDYARNLQRREPGLSTSRWAPRNASAGDQSASFNQVWTRTSYVKPQKAQQSSTPPTLQDLGLPYEVQHFILNTMQRILEEACYTFATRWIPGLIYEKGWKCAEQIELKTWRDELPDLLPPGAIIPQMNYPLTAALRDAVAIRNSATHRHLCDNTELKRMSRQGSSLMAMFGDPTRESKFNQLWNAIQQWDIEVLNPETKKDKLEHALQEISERPMNDMDWSPNVLSLEQIQEPPFQVVEDEIINDDDPMDMD